MPFSTRRQFLARTALASGALAFGPRAFTAEKDIGPRGKAEHCLFIWLGGGMAHLAGDPALQSFNRHGATALARFWCSMITRIVKGPAFAASVHGGLSICRKMRECSGFERLQADNV